MGFLKYQGFGDITAANLQVQMYVGGSLLLGDWHGTHIRHHYSVLLLSSLIAAHTRDVLTMFWLPAQPRCTVDIITTVPAARLVIESAAISRFSIYPPATNHNNLLAWGCTTLQLHRNILHDTNFLCHAFRLIAIPVLCSYLSFFFSSSLFIRVLCFLTVFFFSLFSQYPDSLFTLY